MVRNYAKWSGFTDIRPRVARKTIVENWLSSQPFLVPRPVDKHFQFDMIDEIPS